MNRVKIAFVGVGVISGIYLKNITEMFREIEITGVCDLIPERAENAAREYGVAIYPTYSDLLADPSVEIVLNLTRPNEHFDITMAALAAGKHVYTEKPLATNFEDGKKLLDYAKSHGLLLGGAPDTFLGAAIQTCRKLIDDGFIGRVIGAGGFMMGHGPEDWHPGPEFFYKPGAGPMLDMGPYYVTALVNLMGPVAAVTAVANKSFAERLITSEPLAGTVVGVDVPTHYNGILEFESGAVGTLTTTFDVYYPFQSRLEIYGTQGSLLLPDPNYFGGVIKVMRPGARETAELPLFFDYAENSRGLGIADMAKALRTGRGARVSGEMICHVLEIMTGFEKSSDARAAVDLETRFTRGAAMVRPRMRGILD